MQEVRGSNPLSSTPTPPQVTASGSAQRRCLPLPDCRIRATRVPLRADDDSSDSAEAAWISSSSAAAIAASRPASRAGSAGRRPRRSAPTGHQFPGARPRRNRQRGRRVPQIVEAKPLDASRPGGRPPHPTTEVASSQQSPFWGWEHQPIRAALAVGVQMVGQGGGRDRRQGHGAPAGLRLGRAPLKAARHEGSPRHGLRCSLELSLHPQGQPAGGPRSSARPRPAAPRRDQAPTVTAVAEARVDEGGSAGIAVRS
jgi:hypothetical protein